MTERESDAALEALFRERRQADPPEVSAALLARIAADAAAEMPRPGVAGRSAVGTLWALLGGWSAAGGLVAAALAGVWIGVAPPDGLARLAENLYGDTVTVELLPAGDIFGTEG